MQGAYLPSFINIDSVVSEEMSFEGKCERTTYAGRWAILIAHSDTLCQVSWPKTFTELSAL
jgi:hypothetical protein